MKIKKVNELNLGKYTKDELKNIRNRQFPNETIIKYHIWGENLNYLTPDYSKLRTYYDMKDVINWYNNEKNNDKSIINRYSNIVLVEETTSTKILDFDSIITPLKYNL